MTADEPTTVVTDLCAALADAARAIENDCDPLSDRESADGHAYVLRILAAASQSVLVRQDPDRPTFMAMADAVRHLGAAGPDIDYDVAAIRPGARYRISGHRGTASYVGICLYEHAGAQGAAALVANVDVDEIAAPDGTFSYEVSHPSAHRVILRQYFHDRSTQARGRFEIDRLGDPAEAPLNLPTRADVDARLAALSASVRWNARLNTLWGAEHRATPNRFVFQTAEEIVAAVPNPDVSYAFGWWRLGEGEALVIEHTPPPTRYWALQLCDRWFQCYPDRRSNLNDSQVTLSADGMARIIISSTDPGHAHWVETGGHHVGTMFFRWLHATPADTPICRVVPIGEAAALVAR